MVSFTLPSTHFLSLLPTFGPSNAHPSSSALAPATSSLASADFEVDVRTGFLPAEPPLDVLPAQYAVWDDLLERAKNREVGLAGEGEVNGLGARWRRDVEEMPILRLPAEHLTAPHLHFASVTLTFLTHFYIHSHPPPTSSLAVPPSLSIPLNQVSELLGLPPVLTYATSVLYNVLAPSPTEVFSLSNPPMTARQTFTGLESEVQFYVVSSLIELHGVRALGIMRAALDEAFVGDKLALRRISAGLRSLAGAITDLTEVMRGMRKRCDPEEFYWLIRPWFKGSDGEGPGGLGWLFEGIGEDGLGERRIVSGPSAGQSSLVHALDVFLGIDHAPAKPSVAPTPVNPPSDKGKEKEQAPALISATDKAKGSDETFMQRMLQYMPGPHRRFLLHLQTTSPTIRDLVLENRDFEDGSLSRAYDEAVTAMGRFRDGHMIIVAQYIISQARRPPPPHLFPHLQSADSDSDGLVNSLSTAPPKMKEAESWQTGGEKLTAFDDATDGEAAIRGTGGTALAKFLKGTKARTVATLVGDCPVAGSTAK